MNNNSGKGFIEELAKELMGSLNMKDLNPEQQAEMTKGMSEIGKIFGMDGASLEGSLKNLMGQDGGFKIFDLKDLANMVEKEAEAVKKDDVKAKPVESDQPFLKRTHGKSNIDMEADDVKKAHKDEKKVNNTSDVLSDIIKKIATKQFTISDLTKEVLDTLVNDERATDNTIDTVCNQCHIDRVVFDHLCKVYEIKVKEKVMTIYPVDVKAIDKSDDLFFFINSYGLLLNQRFADKEFKDRRLINLIDDATVELEARGLGTSNSQTAFPCQVRNSYGDLVTGFAIFNIPLESFLSNFDSIEIKTDEYGCPIFLTKK